MIHINKVKELTGVTTRTLRYYDSIDLLSPAEKTEGGHRLYTNEDIKKLQHIQFLQGIGFKLRDIKLMLNSENWNWSDSLEKQLAYVLKEQENLKEIEGSLKELINGIQLEGEDEWVAIQKIMQLSNSDSHRRKLYRESLFNEKEVALWERVPKMSGDNPDSLEWIALLGQLKRQMEAGPHSTKVQNIIRRMDEKREEKFQGEDDFINKLWEIRKSTVESEKLGLYPIEQELLDFMEDAYKIYMTKKQAEPDEY